MLDRVTKEIEQFNSRAALLSRWYDVEEVIKNVWMISPRSYDRFALQGKVSALTILGIVHGNEVGGLGVLNKLLKLLQGQFINLRLPIVVGLGNETAALQNVRFLDVDLNRSFLNKDEHTREGKRARSLEQVLAETYRLLDIHQTSRKSEESFFIFPFTRKGFEFARKIGPSQAIITHWQGRFSSEGSCTDEFVNKNGGIGISFELGQNGFDEMQMAIGLQTAISAIQVVTAELTGETIQSWSDETKIGKVYSWAKVVAFPEKGRPIFDPDWHNFKRVLHGQRLGLDGDKEFTSEVDGYMLFPKYISATEDLSKRPSELYRVIKEISEADLPND